MDKIASGTREVGGTDGYSAALPLYKEATKLGSEAEATAKSALSKASGDIKSLQGQADKAATGLETMGAGMEAYMQRLQAVQDFTNTAYQSASQNWDAAAEKADEYVTASRARIGEVLAKLDEINEQIGLDRDFSRAHALQAGAQSVIGSMKTEERNILNQYGANSKEYEQFTQSKQVALATMQSNIFANYQQFEEQQGQTYLSATNEAMWKQNMYTSFQEQQHVEMLKYFENAKFGYAMQKAQFDIGVENLRMAGMENWANWIVGTPDFTYDSMPLVTILSDAVTKGREANAKPEKTWIWKMFGRAGWERKPDMEGTGSATFPGVKV
jgi:hypothetical protein